MKLAQMIRRQLNQKKSLSNNIRIKPNSKQLSRGDILNDRKYTIVTRPQKSGQILVAAVYQDGTLVNKDSYQFVTNKSNISLAIKNILRWIDKLGGDSKMADRSRVR